MLLVKTQSRIPKDWAGRPRMLSGDGYRFLGMELHPVSTSASTHRCSPHQQTILDCAANHLARQHLSCCTDTPSYSTMHPHPACQPWGDILDSLSVENVLTLFQEESSLKRERKQVSLVFFPQVSVLN